MSEKPQSSVVGLGVEGANMYGCQPCPKCSSKYRFQLARKSSHIQCDDCGLEEVVTVNLDAPETET